MTTFVSRSEALASGKPVYFSGTICRRGHICERRTLNRQCVECSRIMAKIAAVKFPEAVKERKLRYDERRRADPEVWAAHMLTSLRGRCRRKGLPFNLCANDILSLIPADRICPALGIPLVFGGKLSRNSPSIDRIIPCKGYVRGNIVIISHKANSMKQDCVDPAEIRRLANFLEKILARSAPRLVEESRRVA